MKYIYHIVGTIQYHRNSGKMYTPNKRIHDRSLTWLGTDTSVKYGGVKLLYGPIPPL